MEITVKEGLKHSAADQAVQTERPDVITHKLGASKASRSPEQKVSTCY